MKFQSIGKRLAAIEPAPVDLEEQSELEESKLLLLAFEPHFMTRLAEQGLSDLIDEVKAALKTVGPRPFGHTRPDDRPVWEALDEVSNRHHDLVYRFRAAQTLAWADLQVELGNSEDDERVKHAREYAAEDLRRDAKEMQTTCDKCGADLNNASWYGYNGGTMQKLCRTCIGL